MPPKESKLLRSWIIFAWIVLVVVPGCSTFQYRDVQSAFERAVRIDNGESFSPFTEDSSSEAYREIINQLSEEKIRELDQRLQANAWLLRSFSSWRVGNLPEARSSASKGIREGKPPAHSRDQVLLLLVPALIADSETMNAWIDAGKMTTAQVYENTHEKDFQLAWDKLLEAEEQIANPTPESTVYYVQYQKWRILQNWRQVISRIPASEVTERRAARERAKAKVGDDLGSAAKSAKNKIPSDHTLHKLIEAQGG